MFSIQVADDKKLANFLNSCDIDYVDVFLTENNATFIMNTGDLFCVLVLECTHTPGETPHNFRFSKNLLKQQAKVGVIAIKFSDTDDTVTASFMSGTQLLCSATFAYQKVFSLGYDDKLKLLRGYTKTYGFKLESIAALTKICAALNGTINIESGVVAVNLKNGIRIYKKVNYNETLSLTPKQAQILRKCNDDIFSIENYIGTFDGSFAILTNKLRAISNSEYYQLNKARSQYRANIDFTNLISFACSHAMKIPNFVINVDTKVCSFIENDIQYKIPVLITNEERAKADTFHELTVPFSLIRQILPGLGATEVTLDKKQFFMKMTCNDYNIMFN